MYIPNTLTPYFKPVGRRIKVASIEFTDTGTFNDMYLRSIITKPVSEGAVNQLQQRINQIGEVPKFEASVFSGVASNLLEFSATPTGNIAIPNGWGTSRYNFKLVVSSEGGNLSSKEFYIMQGYTDFCDPSRSGYLDPNMTMYVNSYIAISRTSDGVSEYDRVIASGQMLNSEFIRSSIGQEACTIRPGDLFAGMQTGHIMSYSDTGGQWDSSTHHDERYRFGADSKFNSREVLIPSNYLANVMSSYSKASTLAQYQGDQDTIFGKAVQSQYINTMTENPFIAFISGLKGVGTTSCSFKLGDLSSIVDNTFEPKFKRATGRAMAALPTRGNSQSWNSADLVTQIATYLSNTVSSLAIGLLLTRIRFTSNNHSFNGAIDTRVLDARSPSQNADMPSLGGIFINKFNTEIVPDFATNEYSSSIPYTLFMDIDAFGSTTIQLSFDNSPVTPYVVPTFCDSLIAPVITPTVKSFETIVHDMEVVLNNIDFTLGKPASRVSVPGSQTFQTLF